MMRYLACLAGCCLLGISTFMQVASNSPSRLSNSSPKDEMQAIQQIEMDFLNAEKTTDPSVMERVLADDYVNLTPSGSGPGKAALLENFHDHAGEAPPYTVRQHDMRIFVFNGTTAVAAYTKTYVAKENRNVAHEDTTHVFTKDRDVWKLRLSRSSFHKTD